MLYFVDVGVLF